MILKTSKPYLFFLNSIKWKVAIVVVLAILTGELDDVLYKIFDFSLAIPAFLGTALVLMLAFRTNQAYARWWEARMIWEGIANDTRRWSRMVISIMGDPDPQDPSSRKLKYRLVERQLAWNYALANRLRENPPLEGMDKYLSPDDLDFLEPLDNDTQGILFLQGRDLKKALDQGLIDIYPHVELEECLRSLEASMGKAERIKKTHFPVLYDMIIQTSVYIFCILLTYAIVDGTTVFEAAFAILISTLFLSLDEIARDMQDPFEDLPTDTPMLTIAHSLEKEVLQLLGEPDMPKLPVQAVGAFYIN